MSKIINIVEKIFNGGIIPTDGIIANFDNSFPLPCIISNKTYDELFQNINLNEIVFDLRDSRNIKINSGSLPEVNTEDFANIIIEGIKKLGSSKLE